MKLLAPVLALLAMLALSASAQAATIAELIYDKVPFYTKVSGKRIGTLPNWTHSGERVHLLVVSASTDEQGEGWLRVRLPSRPNESMAWIRSSRTALYVTGFRVVIDRSARKLTVFGGDKRIFSSGVVVGAPSTPTPIGHFALWDRYRPGRSSPLYPWVLETTAHSNVFDEYLGGEGRVALHGMQGPLSVPLGSAVSHGCVRLRGKTVRWLARNLMLGTPITIVA